MNIFSTQFLNSILGSGSTDAIAGLGLSVDGKASPFAMLLSDGTASQNTPLKPTSGLLLNNKGFAVIDKDGKSKDLSSPEILLSDLLGVNWQTLPNGQSLTLANGWTLSVDNNGLLSLSNAEGQLAFPSFTKDELQQLLDAFQNANSFLPPAIDSDGSAAEKAEKADAEEKKQAFKEQKELSINTKKESVDTVINSREKSSIINNIVLNTKENEPLSASVNTSNGSGNIIVPASSSPVITTMAATVTNDIKTNTVTPLQALWNAVQKIQDRQNYLFTQSDYISDGAARGIITPANGNSALIAIGAGTASPMSLHIANSNGASSDLPFDELSFSMDVPADTILANDLNNLNSVPAMMQQQGIRVSSDGNLMGTQPLPAAQFNLIIQKMAQGNDTRTLTVRLDPPELGRVQVSITSGTDKNVRAHIIVEKPEALSMLKRDLASLEKALHDAGISLDGDTISMDLANSGGGQGSFAQQAFMDLWSESNQERMAQTGTEIAIDENTNIDNEIELNEFYQSDTAVNIKI